MTRRTVVLSASLRRALVLKVTQMSKERIKEINTSIRHYTELLKQPGTDFAARTWIELQLIELKKELKKLKDDTAA